MTSLELEIEDFLFTVDFDPGCPPKLSGPPENCYPGDPPEVQLDKVELYHEGETVKVSLDEALCALDTNREDLEEELLELALNQLIDAEYAARGWD